MLDRVSLDLLYLQIIEELDLGWMSADSQTRDILSTFEGKKQKREVSDFWIVVLIIFFSYISLSLVSNHPCHTYNLTHDYILYNRERFSLWKHEKYKNRPLFNAYAYLDNPDLSISIQF